MSDKNADLPDAIRRFARLAEVARTVAAKTPIRRIPKIHLEIPGDALARMRDVLGRSINFPKPFLAMFAPLRPITPPEEAKRLSAEEFSRKRDEAETFVEIMRTEYGRTGNPLVAWRAYIECRAFDIPPPEWVLRYLDDAALGLLSIPERRPNSAAAAVMEALQLKRPGRSGRGNAFSDYMDHETLLIARDVYQCIEEDGDKPYVAWQNVAEKRGISAKTVERAWKDFKRISKRLAYD